MAMILPSSPAPAVVLDASVVVSLTAKEANTAAKVSVEIARYSANGYQFFAPGVLVGEVLYVLCGKLNDGSLSPIDHAQAIQDFSILMGSILPPPGGDAVLILRAETIRGSYTCRRSADGIYIALVEELAQTRTTILLTLDAEMPKQAKSRAPAVTVQVIVP